MHIAYAIIMQCVIYSTLSLESILKTWPFFLGIHNSKMKCWFIFFQILYFQRLTIEISRIDMQAK